MAEIISSNFATLVSRDGASFARGEKKKKTNQKSPAFTPNPALLRFRAGGVSSQVVNGLLFNSYAKHMAKRPWEIWATEEHRPAGPRGGQPGLPLLIQVAC